MIQDNELREVGKLLKPHGINGEIVMSLREDVDPESMSCIILKIDGINVPFFMTGIRPKSNETDLVSLDGVQSESDALKLCGHNVYGLLSEIPKLDLNTEDGLYATDLIGYSVNENNNTLGKIIDIDDSTANCLFIIKGEDGRNYLVPIADEFIENIDTKAQTIALSIPKELLEL